MSVNDSEGYKDVERLEVGKEAEKPAFTFMEDLTLKERMNGFIFCAAIGLVVYLLAFLSLFAKKPSNVKIFACLFSLGMVINILGTSFLIGFKRQLRCMFNKTRIGATLIFLISIALTFAIVLIPEHVPIIFVILLIFVQFGAFFWYCLSYVPYGRSMITGIFSRAV